MHITHRCIHKTLHFKRTGIGILLGERCLQIPLGGHHIQAAHRRFRIGMDNVDHSILTGLEYPHLIRILTDLPGIVRKSDLDRPIL